jgi:diguanylate cyclase (GGDEF)-like protein/PAS domain S-box-containing protein
VAFNLIGHRVEDFASVRSDEERDFLALSMPTSEGASEMCILRGSPDHKGRATILRFMESATPALTIILERFLNIGRSQRYGEKLSALANAAQLLAQSDDLQAALTDLATAIAGSTASDYVSIDVYDADSERFVLRVLSQSRFAGLSVTQTWINSLDPDRPDPRNLEVMRSRQPYLSPDIQNDEREPEAVRRYFEATLIRSMATFPVLFQDEFLGIVAFVYYAPHTFPPEEINFLQGFVAQAATALKALQMHNELQRSTYELKRAADEYVATTNLTGDIIAKLDKHGNWTFLNDAACQFFGKSREELLGIDSTALLHPEDLEPTAQVIRETRAKRAPAKGFVNRQLTPMGMRWVEWNGYPLFAEDGQYVGVQITGRDITRHKQMEEALRESEERYRLLAENTSDLIWIVDLNLKYTYMSPAITRMRGYTVEEITGVSIAETMTPASLEAARKTLAEELAMERMENKDVSRSRKLELEMYCKDGSTIWTEMNMKFLRDADGNPIGIQGVTRDISERKQMEQALRESEERYRILAENASDLIWTMDTNLRYTYMSPSVKRMRGYTAEEVIGTRVNETMTPASLETIRKAFVEETALEKQEQKDPLRSRTLEVEMYCKDGSTVWTEIIVTFLRDKDDRPVGFLGVSRDISERRQMEEERARLHAELEVRAVTDGLTGLYNHTHFYQRLTEEIERSQRYKRGFAVVMLDVDAFKQYNDSRGHQAGDMVLHLIADCIRAGLRSSDLAFRYGGDEFATILLDADSRTAQAIVKRMNSDISRRLKETDDSAAGWLRLSAGVASFPQDATTADDLVRIADNALYDAKRVAHAPA